MTPGVGTRHVAPCTHPRLAGMPLHSTTLGAPVVVVAAVVVAAAVIRVTVSRQAPCRALDR